MTEFMKFPRTSHLAWLSAGSSRDDKVLDAAERDAFLGQAIVIEEKIDGANIGISFTEDLAMRVQNRGQWINCETGGQFTHLHAWIGPRSDRLLDLLGTTHILFGEWCYARHSVGYDRLPDWFVVFDVYDHGARRFWSTLHRNELARQADLSVVPAIDLGTFGMTELMGLLSRQSAFGSGPVEGLYLRCESQGFLDARAKLVRPGFVEQLGEHWSRGSRQVNRLDYALPSPACPLPQK
ncbi:MAG: RNA ligase family protein [Planctomycetota bacterium]|nr:RNA ligase family protein [Planctomycetota bacterium]